MTKAFEGPIVEIDYEDYSDYPIMMGARLPGIDPRLKNYIEDLIVNHNVNTFLFGSRSDFDFVCHKIVTELKEKYYGSEWQSGEWEEYDELLRTFTDRKKRCFKETG